MIDEPDKLEESPQPGEARFTETLQAAGVEAKSEDAVRRRFRELVNVASGRSQREDDGADPERR